MTADVMKRLNQSAWLRRSILLCISTLHMSLNKSGAARCGRERVYKNTIALCVRELCFKTASAKALCCLARWSVTCRKIITRV